MMATNLARAEQARQIAQVVLDGQKSVQRRNQLGQFSTPPDLAAEMAKLGREQLPVNGPIRFLDPAVGTGVFFYAARDVFGRESRRLWAMRTILPWPQKHKSYGHRSGWMCASRIFAAPVRPEKTGRKLT